MLVKRIKKFIEDLKKAQEERADVHFIKLMTEHFNPKRDEDTLSPENFTFINQCFEARWKAVKKTKADYTRNNNGTNRLWIELAKDLAPITNRNYLKILFPDLCNSVDLLSLAPLNETKNTIDFYFGPDYKTLYNKLTLCENLAETPDKLSTRRDVTSSKRSILSVEELSHLEQFKQLARGVFLIKDAAYSDVWDFFQKKIFPNLNSSNELPLPIMAHFFLLVESYFTLKADKQPFSLYKEKFASFLELLYENDLASVNQFYGVSCNINNKSFYLIDFLILLNKAQGYDIDIKLFWLIQALYALNPVFYSKRLQGFYEDYQVIPVASARFDSIKKCKLMLLSLFNSAFTCNHLRSETISICDKSQKVFPRSAEIFKLFESAIKTDNVRSMGHLYDSLIKEKIPSLMKNKKTDNFFKQLVFPEDYRWYEHIKKGTFSSIGVCWFEPKLLIHALVRCGGVNNILKQEINKFLDEFIRTYCADYFSNVQKELRINIIFADFLKEVQGLPEFKTLILFLELHQTEDYRNNFLANCAYHINISLYEMINPKQSNAILSYYNPSMMEKISKNIDAFDAKSVLEIFIKLKKEIYQQKDTFSMPLFKNLASYLFHLGSPILTCEEVSAINKKVEDEFYRPEY